MVEPQKELVATLSPILPTYYEMIINSKTKVPCITYFELSNVADEEGDTIGFSTMSFSIKIWGHDYGQLCDYATKVDTALRGIDYKRGGSADLYDKNSTMIQKAMTYTKRAVEDI